MNRKKIESDRQMPSCMQFFKLACCTFIQFI